MSRDSPLQIVGLNVASAVRHLARHGGEDLDEADGRLFAAGRHACGGSLFNAALRTDRSEDPTGLVQDAIEFFDSRPHAFAIWAAADADADLAQAAASAGLEELPTAGAGAAMIMAVPPSPAPVPAGLTIETVSSPTQAREFANVEGQAFATLGQPPEVARMAFSDTDATLAPGAVAILARRAGKPVSCALLLDAKHSAGIYFVGTIAPERGLGFGEATTRYAAELAFHHGAEFVVLCAVPRAVPLYERIGFTAAGRYALYGRKEPIDVGSAR